MKAEVFRFAGAHKGFPDSNLIIFTASPIQRGEEEQDSGLKMYFCSLRCEHGKES
jgi:hypothetical protein